jgi:GNAT superfamily N-acetyltransferase
MKEIIGQINLNSRLIMVNFKHRSISFKIQLMKFRKANKEDLFEIVKMIADDKLGTLREDFQDPLPEKYYSAFENINNDPNQELVVVENEAREVIGTLQLSFIQYLTYQGGIRAQIEAVRIRKDQRGSGIGEKMFLWAIEKSKSRGAHLLQLTTDKKRPEALKFYERLGFVASHEGMKLHF